MAEFALFEVDFVSIAKVEGIRLQSLFATTCFDETYLFFTTR